MFAPMLKLQINYSTGVFDLAALNRVNGIEPYCTKKVYNHICRLSDFSWQGLESGNITFSTELEFDISELDRIYEMNKQAI